MSRTIHTTPSPVTLEGFQAVMKPGKFGYTLRAIVDQDIIDRLEEEREDCVKWCLSKVASPKRSVAKPEPWEEEPNRPGKYAIKFSWKEGNEPPIVDSEGVIIRDKATPLYEGSKVKIGFTQRPYVLKDGQTFGTSLKIAGIQVVSIESKAGIDSGDLDEAEVAELFGKCQGYKSQDPNVELVGTGSPSSIDDDF
tara:strand:- start:1591 stop:2175 length:585 start_codon:yes stop_codon:yes gene_type:complete